jgi:hypothetical protein
VKHILAIMDRRNLVTTLVAAAAIGIGFYLYTTTTTTTPAPAASSTSTTSTTTKAAAVPEKTEETKGSCCSPAAEVVATAAPTAVTVPTAPALKNQAFVFIKPHANTKAVQELVSKTLKSKGIVVTTEGELTGEEIDKGMLIDQHYYAIASKATLLQPKDLPVPASKFEDFFKLSWSDALAEGVVFNALDACVHLSVNAEELDALWASCPKVKFGGGFYCGKVEVDGFEPIFVFNAFFMSMRSKFVTPGTSIHYYVVEFDASNLSWADFRGNVLGPTDPAAGPVNSLRYRLCVIVWCK